MLHQFIARSGKFTLARDAAPTGPDVLHLHAKLRCVRVTGALPGDPHRVFWRQPVDQFARQSARTAIAGLRKLVDNVRASPASAHLALSIPPTGPTGFAIDLGFSAETVSASFGPLCWTFDSA